MSERYPLTVELGGYYSEVQEKIRNCNRISSQFTMGRVGVTMTFC